MVFVTVTVVEWWFPEEPGPPGDVPPDPSRWVVVIALWTWVTMHVGRGGCAP